jgi:DNA-binding MarR family transcriptional regulator
VAGLCSGCKCRLEPLNNTVDINAHKMEVGPMEIISKNQDEATGQVSSKDDYDLWILMDHAWFAIFRLRQIELSYFGITQEQYVLLHTIHMMGKPSTILEISKSSMRQYHTVYAVMKRMLKNGLAQQEKYSREREYKIILTNKGRNIFRQVTAAAIDMVFSVISPEDKLKLALNLNQLINKACSLLGKDYKRLFVPPPPSAKYHGDEEMTITDEFDKYKDIVNNGVNLWIMLDHTRVVTSILREREYAKQGLNLEQAALIYTIQNNGGSATIAELSNITMRQHHSVSTLVERMNKRRLVKKAKHPGNKKYSISLTKKGEDSMGKVPGNSINLIFSALTPEEKRILAIYLKRLIDKGRDLLGIDYQPPFIASRYRVVR